MSASFRTDLASEAHRLCCASENNTELPGVIARDENLHGLPVTAVDIINEQGSAKLYKPQGKYYTLELPTHYERGADCFSDCVYAAAELISRCLPQDINTVLCAALGNPDITPDALGSLAAGNILVTRHLKQKLPRDFSDFSSLSLCRTGVLGTSGIESAEHIKMLTDILHPDAVIVIDALAGADAERLCRTLQFTDSGIAPGSGVGNNRQQFSPAYLGVPVAAIGMPTVIDAGFYNNSLPGMFVTPRDIDSIVRAAGRIIGYGINLAVHHINIEDVDMLIG